MKRRIFAVLLALNVLLSLTSCSFNYPFTGGSSELQLAKTIAQEIMDVIVERDEEALYLLFSTETQAFHMTREQITEAFDFIDGEIISYELPTSTGGGGKSVREGIVTAENFSPRISYVITDTGKEYRISFQYYLVLENNKNAEGLSSITISVIEGNYGYADRVSIGFDYEKDALNVIPASNAPDYKQYVRGIVFGDLDFLFIKFCPIIRSSVDFEEQLHEFCDFIDGKIVHITPSQVSEDVGYDDEYINRIRYSYFAKIREMKTDTGQVYSLRLYFELVNDGQRDRIGISEIRIMRLEDGEERVVGNYVLVKPENENRRFPY